MVGDRGMITERRITEELRPRGIDWITSLRAPTIWKLWKEGPLQLSLFDEQDLAELRSPDFPGERLIACRNPLLTEDRARMRQEPPGDHRGEARGHRRGDPAGAASAEGQGQDRCPGGQGARGLQGRQALPLRDHRGRVHLLARRGLHRSGGRPGRSLRGAYQRDGGGTGQRSRRPSLQGPIGGRAGVPGHEGVPSGGAPRAPPS
jgi:hypothetical protein